MEPADPPSTQAAPAEPAPPPPLLPVSLDGAPPWPLVAGLVLLIAGGLVVGIGVYLAFRNPDHDNISAQVARWRLIDSGLDAAVSALVIVGGLELVRRSAGLARTGARIVLGAGVVLLVLKLTRESIDTFYFSTHDSSIETRRAFWIWTSRVYATAWLAIAVGIAMACWYRVRLRPFAIAAVVMTPIAVPYDFYAGFLYDLFGAGSGRSVWPTVAFTGLGAVAFGLMVSTLWRLRAPAEPGDGWDRAARGLDRAATSLYARLWIALSGALLVVAVFGNRGDGGESIAKLWMVGVPLANAIASLVLVTGIFGAATLAVAGAPRLRLLGSATALAFVLMISSLQVAVLAYVMVKGGRGDLDDASDTVQALPIVLPVVGGVALVLLGLGLAQLARLVGSPDLQRRATGAIGTVIFCQLVAGIIPWVMQSSPPQSVGPVIVSFLILAGAAILSLLALARLCRELAATLRRRHELPVAQVFK